MVLAKTLHDTPPELELLVIDRATGRTLASDRSSDLQQTLEWRPDSKVVAFLSDKNGDGNFRPFLFDVSTGKRSALPGPSTRTATMLSFAPDGSALAYFEVRGSQKRGLIVLELSAGTGTVIKEASPRSGLAWSPDGRELSTNTATVIKEVSPRSGRAWSSDGRELSTNTATVVIEASPRSGRAWSSDGRELSTNTATVIKEASPRSGLAWSPDGRELASISAEHPGEVVISGRFDRRSRRISIVPDGGEARQLSWAPEGTIYVTARKRGAEYFSLYSVDLVGEGGAKEICALDGDISDPHVLPAGRGVAFHLNHDGKIVVFAGDRRGQGVRPIGVSSGASAIVALSADDGLYIHRVGLDAPAVLEEVRLRDGARTELYRAKSTLATPATAERVSIAASDKNLLPAYLWRARRADGRRPAALIRIHGGPATQYLRVWDRGIQLAVAAGYDVLSLNYRGSTGYGASFERAANTIPAQTQDVLAAIEYMNRELGVPHDRIVLFGHSYGATLAAEAARSSKHSLGGVVLLSIGRHGAASSPRPTIPVRVIAFHGMNDVHTKPAAAKQKITALLGETALAAPFGQFRIFEQEGHGFHRLRSWAEVHAAVLALALSD